MNLTRRDFLKGLAAAAVAGAAVPSGARGINEPEAEHLVFRLSDLDPAHDGLRVAQLSDLHVGNRTPVERIREEVAKILEGA